MFNPNTNPYWNLWYLALISIHPSWRYYADFYDPSLHFFILLHLIEQDEKCRGSKFQKGSDKVGGGNQGQVFGVKDNPDKVMKQTKINHNESYINTMSSLHFGKIASDNGFGPIIYEISHDGCAVDLSNKDSIPKFESGMVFSVVMEKVQELQSFEDVGIVQVWKKMRQHNMLNVDDFFALSPKRNIIVSVDYGVVVEPKNDEDFIEELFNHMDSSKSVGNDYEGVVRKYVQTFPDDTFTRDVLNPVLDKIQEAKNRRARRRSQR